MVSLILNTYLYVRTRFVQFISDYKHSIFEIQNVGPYSAWTSGGSIPSYFYFVVVRWGSKIAYFLRKYSQKLSFNTNLLSVFFTKKYLAGITILPFKPGPHTLMLALDKHIIHKISINIFILGVNTEFWNKNLVSFSKIGFVNFELSH